MATSEERTIPGAMGSDTGAEPTGPQLAEDALGSQLEIASEREREAADVCVFVMREVGVGLISKLALLDPLRQRYRNSNR